MKILLRLLILMAIVSTSSAEAKMDEVRTNLFGGNINRYDEIGNKTGSWLHYINSHSINVDYYNNGRLDGVGRQYSIHDSVDWRILILEFFENSKSQGPIITFYDNELVSIIIDDISINTDYTFEYGSYTESAWFPFQGYCKQYTDKGLLHAEGWYIFDENPLMEGVEVGVWTKYNADGSSYTIDYSEKWTELHKKQEHGKDL